MAFDQKIKHKIEVQIKINKCAALLNNKALQNWKISVKTLSKQIRKLTIITIAIIIVSFINVNDLQ